MPVLPLIDLLILVGWTSLMVGAVQKALWITTVYQWRFLGLTPMDFLVVASVCLLFALTLAARSWVKVNEPRVLRHGRGRAPSDPDALDVYDGPAARAVGADGRSEATAGR